VAPPTLILADDLTGAADCGVQAVRRGLRATVSLRGVPPAAAGDVLALDLDTREGTAANAFERTREAACEARGLLYVKLDSRLRGHAGAAIEGALDGARAEIAVVAPAFPAQRRTTVAGRQRVGGEVVADLVARLREQTTRRVSRVGLAAIRDGGLGRALAEPGVFACDAEDDADLARIVAAGRSAAGRVVWAGSAGLAAALFEGLPASAAAPPVAAAAPGRAVLAVVGSVAPTAAAQLEALLARPGCGGVAVDPAALAAAPEATAGRAAQAASAVLAAGDDAVVHLAPGAPRLDREQAPRIAAGLALAAGPALEHAAGLLLTGGETARAVCDGAGLTVIDLIGEVEPGVPLGRAGTPTRAIVTKSGGFGHPSTLTAALDAIKEHCTCLSRT
jgi:4-hydroxythreonine-4-phosphate dehydrogenase